MATRVTINDIKPRWNGTEGQYIFLFTLTFDDTLLIGGPTFQKTEEIAMPAYYTGADLTAFAAKVSNMINTELNHFDKMFQCYKNLGINKGDTRTKA